MDVLKAQLARMQQQLGALSASQRMLAASLVAMMVLTLLFWGRYAGAADMEPVLDQTLKPDEISRITAQIAAKGVGYKVVGDRILVPADRKLEILADISYKRLVPKDTKNAYDEIIKRVNPLSSQADNDATRIEAKAAYLAKVIQEFPGVSRADVMIDTTNERRIGGASRQPTAAVLVITENPESKSHDRRLVEAAASMVAGAQSGLLMKNVTVVVNGARYVVPDEKSLGLSNGDEILTRQQQWDQHYVQQVTNHLSWIGGVMVTITCDLTLKSESRVDEIYDPTKVASKENKSEVETSEDTVPARVSGEPGAIPNGPLSLEPESGGSTGGGGSMRNRESVTYDNQFSKSVIESQQPAGHAKPVRASVRIPRSYLINLHKSNNPSSTSDIDVETLKILMAQEAPSIRNDVKACTGIVDDAAISVESYLDTLPLMAAASNVAAASSKTGGFGAMVSGHVKEIGIALLALVSLFMVSSMVKKSSPAPVMTAPIELSESPMLASGEDIAGDVGEGNATLDGIELDEDAMKAQQMVEQVATMVKENPDGAANLVKRWLNRA